MTPRQAPDRSGIHTLRFGRGYLQSAALGLGDRPHLRGPLDYPNAHRRPLGDFGLNAKQARPLERLVATWDALISGDDERLSEFVTLRPNGQIVVWPGLDDARVFATRSDDPDGLRFTFARQAVCEAVADLLQQQCRLGFSSQGGFELVPSSVVGLVTMALAIEIDSTDIRDLLCVECGNPLRDRRRSTRTYCGERCKNRARYRRERAAARHAVGTTPEFMVGVGAVTLSRPAADSTRKPAGA